MVRRISLHRQRKLLQIPGDLSADSVFAIIRPLMRHPFSEVRPLLWLGIAGVTLAALSGVVALVHGAIILPEGDLTKSMSFDAAVGIYVLTLALFLPLAEFTPGARRRWIRFVVGLTCFGYAVETIQVLRGIDPRFTRVGGAGDQIAGALFGISALGIMTMFIVLAVKLWRRPLKGPDLLFLLAIRYGSIVTVMGFLSGFWMSALQGRHFGPGGNILPLHALCFHAIQAVPLVALFLSKSNLTDTQAKFWIHLAGLSWLGTCLAVGWQTAMGKPLTQISGIMVTAFGLALLWAICLAKAALSSRMTRQPALAR